MGVSHFLEHMMFKGTARRTAEDVNREFDELGANYNAYTSHEQTVYYAHVLPEFLPRATDLIGDMLDTHPDAGRRACLLKQTYFELMQDDPITWAYVGTENLRDRTPMAERTW